jgi:hypothetical protein
MFIERIRSFATIVPRGRRRMPRAVTMNGTRFVALLVLVAVAAAVWIRIGVPGLPQTVATSPASDTLGGADEPRAAGRPAEAGSPEGGPRFTELIDTSRAWSADTVGAWEYRTTVVADLDADGVPERNDPTHFSIERPTSDATERC